VSEFTREHDAWVAGWLESRLSISAQARVVRRPTKRGVERQDRLQACACGPAPMVEYLLSRFGGALTRGRWRASGSTATGVLRFMLEHARLRRPEIEAAVAFAALISANPEKRGVTGEMARAREAAARAVNALRERRPRYAENRRRAAERRTEMRRITG